MTHVMNMKYIELYIVLKIIDNKYNEILTCLISPSQYSVVNYYIWTYTKLF